MRGPIVVLLLALAAQLLLVALLYWPENPDRGATAAAALLQLSPGQVDEIHIADDHDNEVVLQNQGGRWLLPDLGGLPADGQKVQTLLLGLNPEDPGWPVAQTAAARQRFQVADYHFQRRIIMIGSDELLGTIYLGTAPGFRRVHARAEGQQAVYSIYLNNFDAPAEPDPWLDRNLLQQRVPVSIASELYELRRESGKWVSGWGQEPDVRELMALLDTLENLRIEGLAGEDLQRDLAGLEPVVTLHTNSLDGEQSLELFTLEGRHYIHSSNYDLFFEFSAYDFDRLTSIDAERLMAGAPANPEPGSSDNPVGN